MESRSARVVVTATCMGHGSTESVDFVQGRRSNALSLCLRADDAFWLNKANPGS